MAKIKKVIEDGGIQYPATITDAVKNPNNGKTVTEELSELGSKVGESMFIKKTSSRISQALLLEGGKSYRIGISVKEGVDTSAWTLYRCKGGSLVNETLTDSILFGESAVVDIPQDDDGVWLFTTAEFVGDRTYEVYYWAVDNVADEVYKLNRSVNSINSVVNFIGDDAVNYSNAIQLTKGRISQGLKLPSGKYTISISQIFGTDVGKWGLYRYKDGVLLNEEIINRKDFGDSAEVEVVEGDDGVWLFTFSEFEGARTYEVYCEGSIADRVNKIESSLYKDTKTWTIPLSKSRISRGLFLKGGGKFLVTMRLLQGSDSGMWTLYRYKEGLLVNEQLANIIEFGYSVEVDVPKGDDGIWLFTTTEFEGDRIYEVIIKDVTTIPNKIDNIKKGLNGVFESFERVATNKRIGIWLDNTPNLSEYYLRVNSSNPSSFNFYLYEVSLDHTTLNQLGRFKIGDAVKITRNKQCPSLYIYDYSMPDEKEDGRKYVIDYLYDNTSIESRLKRVENFSFSKWDRKIVCFGDSLTEYRDKTRKYAYSDYIEKIIGAEVINVGVGGAQLRQRMNLVDNPTTSEEAYAALDVVSMVEASCNQNFDKQTTAANYLANNGDDNRNAVDRLASIDWESVGIVTIFAGTNDWRGGVPSGEKDSFNKKETFGAINTIIKVLLTKYPHLKIYWFSPAIRWIASSLEERTEDKFSDNFAVNGVTLKEFSQGILDVVKQNKIPVCDMYNTLGWNQYNFSRFFPDNDGTHPINGEGFEQIAKKIVSFINSN